MEPRLVLRWRFDDGSSETIPFDKAQEQLLDQLRRFAEATGNRSYYEAELRRIVGAQLEAVRAHARRRKAGAARAAPLPREVAALFQQAYDRLTAKGAKRIGRVALSRETRSKLHPDDSRRDQCREHDARRWLEDRRSK